MLKNLVQYLRPFKIFVRAKKMNNAEEAVYERARTHPAESGHHGRITVDGAGHLC
jgi:hypothetical protein